jgi:hypothetical protein
MNELHGAAIIVSHSKDHLLESGAGIARKAVEQGQRDPKRRRRTMKTTLLAAAAVLTLGMGSAFAQSTPSASGYVYPDFWGDQTARTVPQQGHAVAQSNGDPISAYSTHAEQNGTWLFPPNSNSGNG